MKSDRDRVRLERIIESIDRIDRFLVGISEAEFASNEMALDAVLMQLMNIGEMVRLLSDTFKDAHASLPWHEVVGMRNQISHGYFEIRPDTVWRTCQNDLPDLRRSISIILTR